jgi:hypothetical protein
MLHGSRCANMRKTICRVLTRKQALGARVRRYTANGLKSEFTESLAKTSFGFCFQRETRNATRGTGVYRTFARLLSASH